MTNASNKKEKMLIIAAVVILVILAGLFLVIQLSSKEYLVKFNTNGGSPIETAKVKENHKVERPDDPTKDGYVFAGWYYNDKEYNFDTKITKDMTLEAHWKENGIVLTTSKMSILLGDKKKVEVLSLPEDIKMQDLVFSSSDEEVLTVDAEGNITTIKEGTATITIMTKDGKHTAKVEITITKEEIFPKTISIFGFETMAIGETIRLGITYEPDDANNLNFKWTSDNVTVATVDQSGNVTGISEGTATITAESANGLKATHTISVYKYDAPKPSEPTEPTPSSVEVTGITISGTSEVTVGNTIILNAAISPTNASVKSLTWSSSNSAIATVDQNGRVTGVSEGTVIITAKASNGVSATYKVTINDVYVLHLTPIYQEGLTATVYQYSFHITKNGQTINNYSLFMINDHPYEYSAENYISVEHVTATNNAKIKLNDGTIKAMLVEIAS